MLPCQVDSALHVAIDMGVRWVCEQDVVSKDLNATFEPRVRSAGVEASNANSTNLVDYVGQDVAARIFGALQTVAVLLDAVKSNVSTPHLPP